MELVINIPKEQYTLIMQSNSHSAADFVSKEAMMYAIKNGTPLPEGHGRLIDADKLHYCERKGNFSECDTCLDDNLCNLVNEAETIVEADKPKNGCCSCPHSGSIIDGYRDCPDAYTKQSQYCGFYNKGGN